MSKKNSSENLMGKPIEEQASEQTGQKQVRLYIDEKKMQTNYANAFKTSESAEEVILDLGLNVVRPSAEDKDKPEIVFQANNRIIMNHYSIKRLAITLSQIIRRYEQQYGQLELDVSKRRLTETK